MAATAETNKLAREIAHLAHGKALFCLAPVMALLSDRKREIVFEHLADEYADFEQPVARLLALPSATAKPEPQAA